MLSGRVSFFNLLDFAIKLIIFLADLKEYSSYWFTGWRLEIEIHVILEFAVTNGNVKICSFYDVDQWLCDLG